MRRCIGFMIELMDGEAESDASAKELCVFVELGCMRWVPARAVFATLSFQSRQRRVLYSFLTNQTDCTRWEERRIFTSAHWEKGDNPRNV